MILEPVAPDDALAVAGAARILNAARLGDDPEAAEVLPELLAGELRYGWDLEPAAFYLCRPAAAAPPVALLSLGLPRRDNLHLVDAGLTVHPEHRRRGYGGALLGELVRHTRLAGRNTIWLTAAEDDLGARTFLERHGFGYASHDARRLQLLPRPDWAELDARAAEAARIAGGYRLECCTLPTPEPVLDELVVVTRAINDAPMGGLDFEHEHFDLQRLRDFEEAATGRQDEVYRVWARHRETGGIAGHTFLTVNRRQPERGWQGDTAVVRAHRGHRLGLLLKIEMLRWLAVAEPQLRVVETYNHADNSYMVGVNEALGYRLSRTFATYQLSLTS